MFTNFLRSFATTGAIGGLLAAGLVAGPATTIQNVACESPYASSVVTATDLTLERLAGGYGTDNNWAVKVTSDTGETPRGKIRVWVKGARYAQTKSLNGNGEAFGNIPRRLKAGETYPVRAKYMPGCREFKGSLSEIRYYTVKKARTQMDVGGRNISRGQTKVVRVTMRSSTGRNVPGKVRIELYRKAVMKRVAVVRLSNSRAAARFDNLRPGVWEAEVQYLGHRNFTRKLGEDSFRVFRSR